MQTKKAKYHLKRIETIINLHEDSISRLDRDILLEDIRHLYDLVLNADNAHPDKEPDTPRDQTYVKPAEIPVYKEPTQQNTSNNQSNEANSGSPESPEKPEIKIPEEPKKPAPKLEQQAKQVHTPTTVTYEKTSEDVEQHLKEDAYMDSSGNEKTNGRSKDAYSEPTQTEEYD